MEIVNLFLQLKHYKSNLGVNEMDFEEFSEFIGFSPDQDEIDAKTAALFDVSANDDAKM